MLSSQQAKITVKFTEPGFHCWQDAPPRRDYLRNKHRHLFYIDISTWVDHDDRQIEFHDLRDDAIDRFRGIRPSNDFAGMSCEMIGRILADQLCDAYGGTFVVTISEDGEFSAEVTAHGRARQS